MQQEQEYAQQMAMIRQGLSPQSTSLVASRSSTCSPKHSNKEMAVKPNRKNNDPIPTNEQPDDNRPAPLSSTSVMALRT
jgi:hypothetical protein